MKLRCDISTGIILLLLVIGMNSCQKEYLVAEVVTIPDTVSFQENIIPLFTESCISSGCHNTGGIAPDLSAENAYISLNLYGFVNTTEPETSTLYLRMKGTNKPMPPSGKLVDSKLELVLKWIEQGALDN